MPNTDTEQQWFTNHANLVLLTAHLADNGYDAKAIAYAVEKPWKYEDEFRAAAAIVEHEQTPGHTCRPLDDSRWYCDPHVIGSCDWTFDRDSVSA